MDRIRKLEVTMASWYKDMPHLPVKGQKWLAENVWWLVLILTVLSAIGALQIILATWFAGAIVGGLLAGVVGGIVLSGAALFIAGVTMAMTLVGLVLSAMAVSPLRALQKKGWLLLFIILLISALSTIIELLFSGHFGSFIWNLITVAIAGYFLFEIRSYYGKVHVSKRA